MLKSVNLKKVSASIAIYGITLALALPWIHEADFSMQEFGILVFLGCGVVLAPVFGYIRYRFNELDITCDVIDIREAMNRAIRITAVTAGFLAASYLAPEDVTYRDGPGLLLTMFLILVAGIIDLIVEKRYFLQLASGNTNRCESLK
jgi:hypothetical protein